MKRSLTMLLVVYGGLTAEAAAQQHLNTLEEVFLDNQRALQGIATDGESFFTSTGVCVIDCGKEAAAIFKFDLDWVEVNSQSFSWPSYPCHIGDISVDATYLYVPFSNAPNGGPYQIRRFDLDTFEEVSVWGLDELAKLYTGEITSGLDIHDGDLFLIEYQQDGPDNAHIIQINIDPLYALGDYEITTRYANGIEFYRSYVYIANGAIADQPFGFIDVYDFDQMTPSGVNAPIITYTYDVSGGCFGGGSRPCRRTHIQRNGPLGLRCYRG